MNTAKFLKGTIAGGIVFFLLGWLVYGALLSDFYANNCNDCMNRAEEDMVWWAMILANLLYGAFYAIVWDWSGVSNAMEGLKKGAMLTFVLSLSMTLYYHSMLTMYNQPSAMVVDVVVGTVVGAITGAVIAWAMNMGTSSSS